jgi:hypothetical protein
MKTTLPILHHEKGFILRILIILLFVLSMAGCSSYNIKKIAEDSNGNSGVRLLGIHLSDNSWIQKNSVDLIPQKITNKSEVSKYAIQIVYKGDGLLNIIPEESLIFLIDGEKVTYSGTGSKNSTYLIADDNGMNAMEISSYNVTKDFLDNLSKAKSVKIKLVGYDKFMTLELSTNQLANINRFMLE